MKKLNKRRLIRSALIFGASFGTAQALSIFVPAPQRSLFRFICGELMMLGVGGALIPVYSKVIDSYEETFKALMDDPKQVIGIDYYFGE